MDDVSSQLEPPYASIHQNRRPCTKQTPWPKIRQVVCQTLEFVAYYYNDALYKNGVSLGWEKRNQRRMFNLGAIAAVTSQLDTVDPRVTRGPSITNPAAGVHCLLQRHRPRACHPRERESTDLHTNAADRLTDPLARSVVKHILTSSFWDRRKNTATDRVVNYPRLNIQLFDEN